MAHTKGEWQFFPQKSSNGIENDAFAGTIQAEDGYEVAGIWGDFGEEGECKANAHLIAAAPDMLEALEMICESGVMLSDEITVKLIAAIKKAKGE